MLKVAYCPTLVYFKQIVKLCKADVLCSDVILKSRFTSNLNKEKRREKEKWGAGAEPLIYTAMLPTYSGAIWRIGLETD